ncbi:AraC family transcriptional regulator [Empedobacter sp. GD03644]|uniref:helix-turn-helix domain-containing protein n=1 Tax=Empedobacter sp. GD03644 TaxID=2975358 RepID=UPI00244899B5|nr:AraC family transcriptional regulator [Empedobacter sp. GD03644]MDH2208543.1 AraC family transcriptional regulator [Empedobacter sp. GD03644]
MNTLKNKVIEKYKQQLIRSYIYLMLAFQVVFFLIFYLLEQNRNSMIIYFPLIEFIFIFYTYSLIKKSFNIEKVVTIYLIIAPLLLIYSILNFWSYGLVLLVWLIPLPFGAQIFFSPKKAKKFTYYTIIVLIFSLAMVYCIDYDTKVFDKKIIKITDFLNLLFNGIILYVLIYYQNKIKQVRNKENDNKLALDEESNPKKIVSSYELNEDKCNEIFSQIDQIIVEKELFKAKDFSLSQLSVELKINSKYLSTSLKSKGFTNFNHYLNSYRIQYAKDLIINSDLNKVTLLYIYSEAGFANQSTFNRVFKNLEGITPSEFIKNYI